ncbi:MAG: head-tail connector protein [Pontiella sp.]|nr:head-tail connector protein [Pontiella sp.]
MKTIVKAERHETGGADAEPITVAEVQSNSNIGAGVDDTFIEGLIRRAVDLVEDWAGISIMQKQYTLKLDQFPSDDETGILLPFPPAISISSVKYYDDADTLQTWSSDDYELDASFRYGAMLYPVRTAAWPASRTFRDSVEIVYLAGYPDDQASADTVPEDLKGALLLMVGHWYENREATTQSLFNMQQIPLGVHALLGNYRAWGF